MLESIRNPVTVKVHRAIIEAPEGYESSRIDQAPIKNLLQMMVILTFDMKGRMEVSQKIFGKDLKRYNSIIIFEIEYHLQAH